MGTVFWAIVSWWLFIAVISSFYFWAKKTDRSQAPLERRITAVGYGLAWPYLAYKGLKGKQNRTANLAKQRTAQEDIPGGAMPPSSPTATHIAFETPTVGRSSAQPGVSRPPTAGVSTRPVPTGPASSAVPAGWLPATSMPSPPLPEQPAEPPLPTTEPGPPAGR
jgi:hypothetical protein